MTRPVHMQGDFVSGAVLTALGGYIISEALHWTYSGPEGPGPGFFPLWYGMAMVVLSLALMLGCVLRGRRRDSKKTDWKGVGRALMTWVAFAGSIALLKILGFLLSLALLTLFIVWVMYGKPLRIALMAAIGSAAGFYLVFALALNISLPAGMLGF